jgi:hypothetical protein
MDNTPHVSNMVLDSEPPRLDSINHATGEERRRIPSTQDGIVDAGELKPSGGSLADVADGGKESRRCTKPYAMGTWNVRGMSLGKLDIVKQEMQRTRTDIVGISELHWIGSGEFVSGEYTLYFSGNEKLKRNGVAFMANKRISSCVVNPKYISDRVMTIRIKGKPLNVTVILLYAPTTDATKQDIEQFYATVQRVYDQVPNKDIVYIMGDFNAKVGEGEVARVAGRYGLGVRNDAGDRLIRFCQENKFTITNTLFTQPKRRLYTWTSPDGLHRNQIDYILCQKRWKSSIVAAKTLPGADCGSDHQLLIAKVRLRFCKTKRPTTQRKFDTANISTHYAVEVKNRFDALSLDDKHPDDIWTEVKRSITESARKHVANKKPAKASQWLAPDTIRIAERRREAKAKGRWDEARRLNAEFQREARNDKNRFLNERCSYLEEEYKKGHTRQLYAYVKQKRKPFSARQGTVKDRDGIELSDQQAIKDRWREYTEELYDCTNEYQDDHGDQVQLEPDVLESEVEWAIRQLPNNKAPGVDGIPAELLKPIPRAALTALCQKIWRTCSWPKEWKRSVFIRIPKKGDPRNCANYRTHTTRQQSTTENHSETSRECH